MIRVYGLISPNMGQASCTQWTRRWADHVCYIRHVYTRWAMECRIRHVYAHMQAMKRIQSIGPSPRGHAPQLETIADEHKGGHA